VTRQARVRETAASAAQYLLLGGFAAVAAGISAQGLTGFARQNMGLRGPWPYLLFLALDGAAGVCAVLMTRRAARAESGLAPRLAVWGLVGASASFNWAHAPHRPGAPEAFGLMPVIGAILFEFTLRELRVRSAGRADRKPAALRWVYPAERIRVQLRLAADEQVSAEAATRGVRVDQAARRLYRLRLALHALDQGARPAGMAARRARIAERRAHAALTRVGFADPAVAANVLRQVQVLTRTPHLARLDYTTAAAAHAAIASLIAAKPPAPSTVPDGGGEVRTMLAGGTVNSHSAAPQPGRAPLGWAAEAGTSGASLTASQDGILHGGTGGEASLDPGLVAAAASILAKARQDGSRLSQKALAGQLRREGHRVANHTLNGLVATAAEFLANGHAGSDESASHPPPRPAPHRHHDGNATAASSWLAERRPLQAAAQAPGSR
jgi:hypothetical protein